MSSCFQDFFNLNFKNYVFILFKKNIYNFNASDLYLFPENGRIDDRNVEKKTELSKKLFCVFI